MTIHYVTGVDSQLFSMACILLQSFAKWEPDAKLSVCDFGLTTGQRRILERTGSVVFGAAGRANPWMAKASLCEYLRHRKGECYVWLDADMLIVRPFIRKIESIAAEMRQRSADFAVCADNHCHSIAAFLATWSGHTWRLDDFRRMLTTYTIDAELPYLNSGFFLCRSLTLLEHWEALAMQSSSAGFLVEQNAFNVVVHGFASNCVVLDARIWNVHGTLLSLVRTEAPDRSLPSGLTCDGLPVQVAHATGPEIGRDYVEIASPTVHGANEHGSLRLFVNPLLRRMQLQMLGEFRTTVALS